jgi:hypothetical protein
MALTEMVSGERVHTTEYHYEFWRSEDDRGGYSFPCDADGNIEFTDDRRESFDFCQNEVTLGNYIEVGVMERNYSEWEPAHGKCPCGRTVWLTYDNGYGVGCDCGRDYNLSGQELAPRSQWDEYMNDGDTHMVSEMNGGYNDY